MGIVEGIILGTVQGLTEFLPVSSSGHLIIARQVFGLSDAYGLSVDAVLQLATVLAVGIYFFKDLWHMAVDALRMAVGKAVEPQRRIMVLAVILGTIPAVVLGLLLESFMETVFRDVRLVAVTLIAGAVLMWVAERRGQGDAQLSVRRGVLVGVFQSLALVPGVSRSGATISGGLLAGLPRAEAARFSFLLAFPIILGSGAKKFLDLGAEGGVGVLGGGLLAAVLAAFVVGLVCIHFLLGYLRRHTLMAFVWYRIGLAALLLVLFV